MINFTIGPVTLSKSVCSVGAEQVPYFRTEEFSQIMFENERLIKKFFFANEENKVVFITGSGTASMEASIINCLSKEDKVLVVNGGSFGQRFVDLLKLHGIQHTEIKLAFGKSLSKKMLNCYDNKGFTAFLVNLHETSTGVLYDIKMISEFCKKNNLFLLVDSISSFLADEFNMEQLGVDLVITGSQKALACPPGISIIVLSKKAIKRIEANKSCCLYLDLKLALKNGKRGQTPFTPAVGILRQINTRLKEIDAAGGCESEIKKIHSIATDFRKRIKDLPFEIISDSLSNAETPLYPKTGNAYEIYLYLKNEYGIWVCPNGGILKEKLFRVGHIGDLTIEDNIILINALKDLQKRGII